MAGALLRIPLDVTLARYLREIHRFPILSAGEELELVCRWRDRRDVEAPYKLVTSQLRFVAKVATGYRGYGLPVSELIGERNMGVMKAVQRLDPTRGVRFAIYASWWIRSTIHAHILYSCSLVKMGTTELGKDLPDRARRFGKQEGADV
jgi:RNA polymerase sigma-32 factor